MKSMSSGLQAAQRAPSAEPYVYASFRDELGSSSMPRLRWEQWYPAGGAEGESPVAAICADDDALVRLRSDGGDLYISRVATPTSASTYSSWSSFGSAYGGSDVALVMLDDGVSDGELRAFYVDTDHDTLKERVSTDGGATWGSATTILSTGAATKDRLAACASKLSVYPGGSGYILLVWAEGGTLYKSVYNGSSWGSRTAFGTTMTSVSGISIAYDGDFVIAVTGVQAVSGRPGVWHFRYGDGFGASVGSSGTLREAFIGAADSDTYWKRPALLVDGALRLAVLEAFDGDASYVRVHETERAYTSGNTLGTWRELRPLPQTHAEGVAYARDGSGRRFLVGSDFVWSYQVPEVYTVPQEDIVAAELELDGWRGRGRLELDNSGGAYTAYGAGTLVNVRRGACVELGVGYYVAGVATLPGGSRERFWVESLELLQGERPRLVVNLRGGDWLLERWRARRHIEYTVLYTLDFAVLDLVAKAGLALGYPDASDAFTTLAEGYTVQPGESLATVLRRLLAHVPDVMWVTGATVTLAELDAGASSADYAFGPDEHPLLQGRYVDRVREHGRARVYGADVQGEATDYSDDLALGEALGYLVDRRLADAGGAGDIAAAMLRREELAQDLGELRLAGWFTGVELFDVVEVTDEPVRSAALYRVRAYRWWIDRFAGEQGMTIGLTNV